MNREWQGFKEQIQGLNQALREKYQPFFQMEEDILQEKLSSLGSIHRMELLQEEDLKAMGPIVGVDGSTVRLGGAYPHYVEIFQGLAKSTEGKDIFIQRLYSPVLDPGSEEEGNTIHNRYLAEVEIDCAIAAIEETDPKYLLMDGGLLRYKINAEEKWTQLEEICLKEKIYICGAIKDIKSHIVSEGLGYGNQFYDREVLAGKLKLGQIFIVNEANAKKPKGFSSAFYRPSKHNEVVGIDVLEEQKDQLETMCRILYNLTPRESRGVPFWMDIVDKECKLTPPTLKALLEENMDRDLLERFFVSERDRRN